MGIDDRRSTMDGRSSRGEDSGAASASGARQGVGAPGRGPLAASAAGARAASRSVGLSVSIVVPTLNAGTGFEHLCRHLARVRTRYGVEVMVIDSDSTDGTPERARAAGLNVYAIEQSSFGHGRTRNLGVRLTSGEVVAFLTQDVLPVTPDWPLRFASALAEPGVAGVYGRQVPRDASTVEMFFVALNYPDERLRFDPRSGHHPRPGRVLFSNAFSAVRRDVATALPFVDYAPVSEDQIWAHQALAAGHAIVYRPDAEALHAHHYTIRGLFGRSRTIGRALRLEGIDGGASLGESARFLATEIAYFVRQGHAHRLPQLLPYEFVRWAGFQAGRWM
jgi:rhamnosyltransferase